MLETSRMPQRLQHPALTVAAWMKRLSYAPREALQCTAGFSRSQSGRELAELHLDITPPLCRQTGCSYIPKTPLLFMVKMVHSFPAQGFKGFTFKSTAPRLTHVQGIMWCCQLVPGNFILGQWQWPLCLSPGHFLLHSWPHDPEAAIRAAGSLQRKSTVVRPGLLCTWSSFSLWMRAGAAGRQHDCSNVKNCERGKSFHI